MSTTRLCGVREGGDLPAQYPTLLVKTSGIYVTYVTPVTVLNFLFVLAGSGGTAKTPSNQRSRDARDGGVGVFRRVPLTTPLPLRLNVVTHPQ